MLNFLEEDLQCDYVVIVSKAAFLAFAQYVGRLDFDHN